MISTANIVQSLDRLLRPEAFSDFAPNGLQVPGPQTTGTLVTAVSASAELFERAAAAGADLVLVHHGLFWKGMPQHVDAALHRRLRPLFAHDMALAAYHLPLDAHPEVGNNALVARGLGAIDVEPRFAHDGVPIGASARFAGDGIAAADLHARVRELTGREPLHFAFGPERVRTIGIVTGAGASYLGEAIDAGLDAFLTGEPAERVMTQAREAGVHFLAAGHYATETFGVRRLGDLMAEMHGIAHHFLDDPNPV